MDSSTDTNHEYGKHAIKKTCTDYPIYTLKLILFNNILFQVFGGTVVNFGRELDVFFVNQLFL
jgi:hypothetical protein